MGNDGHDGEIYTINAGGGRRTQVTHNTTYDQEPSYSPSGKRIAYSGWDGQDWEIYTINVDGSGRVQLTHNSTKDGEPSYSPDGGGRGGGR